MFQQPSIADRLREAAGGFTVMPPEFVIGLMTLGATWALHVAKMNLLEDGMKTTVNRATLIAFLQSEEDAIKELETQYTAKV